MAKDFYEVLNVDRKANAREIKKAYRKLARQYHPDVNPNDPNSEARFKEINTAYQVLSDEEKRKLYDQFGEDWDKVQAGSTPGNDYARNDYAGNGYADGGYPGVGVDFGDLFSRVGRGRVKTGARGAEYSGGTHVEKIDPEQFGDLFGDLFGGFGGGGFGGDGFNFGSRRRSSGPRKGQDFEQPVEISLAESIHGTQRDLQLAIHDPVTGEVERRNVGVKIPAGVWEGARVRAAGQGALGANGGPNGDLYLRVHIQPHPFWRREGDDLHCEVPITFVEAALGATIEVPGINGPVGLKIPAGTQCDQTFRLSGRGVPHLKGDGAGAQYVKVKVVVPQELKPSERELIEELARLRDENVRQDLPKSL